VEVARQTALVGRRGVAQNEVGHHGLQTIYNRL
jgi:hypothetical protein